MKTKSTKQPWFACDLCGALLTTMTYEERMKYVPGAKLEQAVCPDCVSRGVYVKLGEVFPAKPKP